MAHRGRIDLPACTCGSVLAGTESGAHANVAIHASCSALSSVPTRDRPLFAAKADASPARPYLGSTSDQPPAGSVLPPVFVMMLKASMIVAAWAG